MLWKHLQDQWVICCMRKTQYSLVSRRWQECWMVYSYISVFSFIYIKSHDLKRTFILLFRLFIWKISSICSVSLLTSQWTPPNLRITYCMCFFKMRLINALEIAPPRSLSICPIGGKHGSLSQSLAVPTTSTTWTPTLQNASFRFDFKITKWEKFCP